VKKINRTTFYIYILLIIISYVLNLTAVIDHKTFVSIFTALFLNLINLFAALLFYYLSINRSNQVFMLLNIGGMGVRVFFLLFGVMMSLIFLEIDEYAFILVFLIFYSISIYIEIKYFYKVNQKPRE